jgi:intracellular septation protein A
MSAVLAPPARPSGRQRATRFAAMLGEVVGLLVFWILIPLGGLRLAIAGAVVVVLLEAVRRWRGGHPFTRVWLLASTLMVVCGAIDLAATRPFLLVYESVVTNLVTALAFIVGARGPRSMIQELAEQQNGEPFPDRADLRQFFRLFTLAWAVYFLVKAAFYLWLARTLSFEQAMVVRSVVGPVSLALLATLSFSQGRRLFLLCQRLGLLPKHDIGRVRADCAP